MKLAKDARIITAGGQDVGNLNRFVIDPRNRHVTHIVFEQGLLSPKEHVLPMVLVDRVEDDKIYLKDMTFDLEELPPFEEDKFIVTNEHALNDGDYLDDTPGLVGYYYYPPAVTPNIGGYVPDLPTRDYNPPNYGPTSMNSIPVPGADEKAFRKEVDQNIPDETVALKEGAKVYSSDSKHVGDVEKLFLDERNDVSHMMITKGLFFKERKVIPTSWVSNIFEKEVYLAVESGSLERLPDYREEE